MEMVEAADRSRNADPAELEDWQLEMPKTNNPAFIRADVIPDQIEEYKETKKNKQKRKKKQQKRHHVDHMTFEERPIEDAQTSELLDDKLEKSNLFENLRIRIEDFEKWKCSDDVWRVYDP